MLPQIAAGDANTIWVIPSELTQALAGLRGGWLAPDAAPADPPKGAASPNGGRIERAAKDAPAASS
jgi:hypothetical protein